jgi:hypothetical protein
MTKMNRILVICIAAMFPFLLNAQDSEVGLIIGTSGYSGDLTPNTNYLSTGQRHAALGIFLRKDLNRFTAVRGTFTYGKLSGDDAKSNIEGVQNRNLSFQSNLLELSLVGEINPLGTNSTGRRLQPYLYGGIAVFHFKPEANYNGQLVELQPLGTEGQGMEGFDKPYKLTQISIPLGAGVKYQITERINIGVDVGVRKTFTDYLDDVSGTYVNYNDLLAGNGQVAAGLGNRSGELNPEGNIPAIVPTGTQRGNSLKDDWYFTAGVTVGYKFSTRTRNYKGRNPTGKEFGCPGTKF